MFSRPVSWGWKPAPVAISPATRPRVSTEPESGRITPLMILSSVDLPDPLSPMRPMDSPCSTVKRHVVQGEEGVADVLAAGHRHGHLLEGAVVAQRELLGDVLDDDGLGHLTAAPRTCSPAARTPAAPAPAPPARPPGGRSPRAKRLSGMCVGDGGLRVGRGADPEEALVEQHGLRHRVEQVELRRRPEALVDHAVGVDHRARERHEDRQRADDVAEVAEEHVRGAEQQRHGRAPDPDDGEAEQPGAQPHRVGRPAHREAGDGQDDQRRARRGRPRPASTPPGTSPAASPSSCTIALLRTMERVPAPKVSVK